MTTTDRWPTRAATRLSSESGARPGTASNGVMSDAQLGWELCIVGHEVAVKVQLQVHYQDLSKRTKESARKAQNKRRQRSMHAATLLRRDRRNLLGACLMWGLQYMSEHAIPKR
jgi:hypothetical protein